MYIYIIYTHMGSNAYLITLGVTSTVLSQVSRWSYLRSDTCLHAERIGNSPSRLRSACSACLMLKFHEPKTVIGNIWKHAAKNDLHKKAVRIIRKRKWKHQLLRKPQVSKIDLESIPDFRVPHEDLASLIHVSQVHTSSTGCFYWAGSTTFINILSRDGKRM